MVYFNGWMGLLVNISRWQVLEITLTQLPVSKSASSYMLFSVTLASLISPMSLGSPLVPLLVPTTEAPTRYLDDFSVCIPTDDNDNILWIVLILMVFLFCMCPVHS